MSSTAPSASDPTDRPPAAPAALHAEIDRLDDAIHDLLMARAEAAARIGALGGQRPVALRPGHEADILRRLLRRHRGELPRRAVVRVWRELLAAITAMQGPYAITVCEAEPGSGYAQCAREHFGALTPLRVHRSPAQAIAEVSVGTAVAAVLPMPTEEETSPWWTSLLHRMDPRIHVVARLPFWGPRPGGVPRVQALVVAAMAPDPSSEDRSLITIELPPEQSRARLSVALVAAGFGAGQILLRRDPRVPVAQALVDLDGFVTDDDPRLAALSDALRPPVVLGAYALPVEGDNT
jgi:chorismate mutase/prephenate dehydratase